MSNMKNIVTFRTLASAHCERPNQSNVLTYVWAETIVP